MPTTKSPLADVEVDVSPELLAELRAALARKQERAERAAVQRLRTRPWNTIARPKQLPPHHPKHHLPDDKGYACGCSGVDSSYEVFLMCAGRGLGKTMAGANNIVMDALAGCTVVPGGRCPSCPHVFAVIAPRREHIKEVCFEGASGILNALEDGELLDYNKSSLIITLTNGAKIQGFSAENEEKFRGPNFSGCWVDELGCLPGSTLVATETGDVPIRDVMAGMRVYTRNGLRKVLWSGPTRHNAELLELRTADGHVLRCTPDHRVWADDCWIEARTVRPGATLTVWSYPNSCRDRQHGLNGTASAGIACRLDRKRSVATTVIPVAIFCTEWSGNMPTAPFPLAVSSTTMTRTRPTTTQATWFCSAASPSTAENIPRSGNILTGSRKAMLTQLLLPEAELSGLTASHTRLTAGSAAPSSGLLGSAPLSADPTAAHATVVVSCEKLPSREAITYDLTVEDEPEFYANGVLVHNSFRYESVWHNMRLALRIGKRPRIYVTTTPRPTPLIKQLFKDAKAGKVHVTTGSTDENKDNLSDVMVESLYGKYGGTRLGRQELEGHLLEDIPGALWHREWLDRDRVRHAPQTLTRCVVSIDPATTSGEDSDETGIVVAAQGSDGHGYVLADFSMRDTPFNCCKRAVDAWHEFKADVIVAEQNNGGDYVRDLVNSVDPNVPYRQVYATRGKATRAQPVSSLYEQHKVHHVGSWPELEDQMCCAAGTLAETARGQVPIEHVAAGDLVMTRAGWAPVQWAGISGVVTRLFSVAHEHGSVNLTACHPVWSPSQSLFANASDVLPGQHLSVSRRWADMDHRWPGVVAGGTGRPPATIATLGASCFTAPSGSTTTGQSLMAYLSTTKTTIPATTRSATFPWSHQPNMRPNIPIAAGGWTPKLGASMQPIGGPPSRGTNVPARNAVPSSSPGSNALLPAVTSAVESVQTVKLAKPTPVYNLSVAPGYLPEFYANGVLVHNCTWLPDDPKSPDRVDALVWAVYWLRGLYEGSVSAAFGFGYCPHCKAMVRMENLDHCLKCGEAFDRAA